MYISAGLSKPVSDRVLAGLILLLLLGGCSGSDEQTGGLGSLENRFLLASPEMIAYDPELDAYMHRLAEQAIEQHCAACHGADLQGQPGVPDLTDHEWLWGISGLEMTSVEAMLEIQQTITWGIRNDDCPEEIRFYGACPDTRYSEMPAYHEILSAQQLADMTEYVLQLSGREVDAEAAARAEPFWPMCIECHGEDGRGYLAFGGPDLGSDVWLYGDDRETILDVIAHGRMGVCPAWGQQLDAVTIKALSVYIYNRYMGF